MPNVDRYYEPEAERLFTCPDCDRELDESDREPQLTICRGCYRRDGFFLDLHEARRIRRARLSAIAAGSTEECKSKSRPAEGDAAMFVPVDTRTLDALLAELSPHVAGEVIDLLDKIGALPETHHDPDRVFVFVDEPDPPPTRAAAADARVLVFA